MNRNSTALGPIVLANIGLFPLTMTSFRSEIIDAERKLCSTAAMSMQEKAEDSFILLQILVSDLCWDGANERIFVAQTC